MKKQAPFPSNPGNPGDKTTAGKEQPDRIHLLETERDEWKARYARALADFQNLERRVSEHREDTVKFASKELILKLLEVLDTLEQVVRHVPDEGLRLAVNQLNKVLSSETVERIQTRGKVFDPHTMECIQTDGESDRVVEEFRAGYRMHGEVIRVAQVKVGKDLFFQEQKQKK